MQLTKFRVHFTFQLYREDNNKTKLTHTHWHTIIITTDEGFVSWLGKTFSYRHRNTADTSLTHTTFLLSQYNMLVASNQAT